MRANGQSGPILIVDDDAEVREMLRDVFRSDGYQCRLATNGREALEAFAIERPPLTVTDLRMPVMDGIEFVKHAHALDPEAMVLVLTGAGDVKTAVETLTGGAYDFILKPVSADALLEAAQRALDHRQVLAERRECHAALERRIVESARELEVALRQLDDTYRSTIEALGAAIVTRDVGTYSHSRRVRGYTLAIARAHGISEAELQDIDYGVLLHDIGKIGMPDGILLKSGPLTPAEWEVMKKHPDIGRQLIEKIPFLRGAAPLVYHHHERWDGAGYPVGLRGEAIPLGARIFAVADALDAMTVDRPYCRAVSFETARLEIRNCADTQFDPAVVTSFLTIPVRVLTEIRRAAEEPTGEFDAIESAVHEQPSLAQALRMVHDKRLATDAPPASPA
jgi:response regulator RpfG family c-di-GMP phosphodiesterase